MQSCSLSDRCYSAQMLYHRCVSLDGEKIETEIYVRQLHEFFRCILAETSDEWRERLNQTDKIPTASEHRIIMSFMWPLSMPLQTKSVVIVARPIVFANMSPKAECYWADRKLQSLESQENVHLVSSCQSNAHRYCGYEKQAPSGFKKLWFAVTRATSHVVWPLWLVRSPKTMHRSVLQIQKLVDNSEAN